jgi:hypothetical protein
MTSRGSINNKNDFRAGTFPNGTLVPSSANNQSAYTVISKVRLLTDGTATLTEGNLTGLNTLIVNNITVSDIAIDSITFPNLTANTALMLDSNKAIASSDTTDTELSYVHGVTSSIQSQLNSKLSSVFGTSDQINVTPSGSDVTLSIANNAIFSGTGSVGLPKGTTAQRSGSAGSIRFNTNSLFFETTSDGSIWNTIQTSSTAVTSVNGTVNRINVSPITGDATVDISANYSGQSSITTLGTVSSGLWNGNVIDPVYGGTGVNNGSNTLTLGGALTTSGAFASTFTMTGPTSVTFPTSGILMNKTLANSHIFVGNLSNTATDVAVSGDINISNTGNTTIQNNVVTNGKLFYVPGYTWKGNNNAITTGVNDNTLGTLSENVSSVLIIANGVNSILNDASIQVKQANGAVSGYLTSTDWNTFNNKQNLVASPVNGNILIDSNIGQATDSGVDISTDATFLTASNFQVPTALAVQTYVNNTVVSGSSFRGGYDASTNLFPSTGGSGGGGSVEAGNYWIIIVPGTLGGTPVAAGNTVTALVVNPGQTSSNWFIQQSAVSSVNGQTGSVSLGISNLNDVSEAGLSDAQVLIYNNGISKWTNNSISSDATIANTGVLTLATVNGVPGSTTLSSITTNAKGLVTSNTTGNLSGDITSTGLTTSYSHVVPATKGGTGVNNGANMITIGGNLTTMGTFDLTATLTSTTNVTFPTSGTLATTSQIPIVNPSALTKADDTNVTLTLGGSPSTALLQSTSITAGWSGTLSGVRGGTGVANIGKAITLGGNLTTSGTFDLTTTLTGTTNVTFPTSGTLAITSQIPTVNPSALTKTDDTNVTLTLGGTPSTALLQASSITAGWSGQLGLTRGGTNNSLTASNGGIVWSDSSKLNILSGTATANQMLMSGSSATPGWSNNTWPSTNSQGDLIYGNGSNTITTLAKNTTATRYLANTGTSNNPNWDQVNLTNGVTGTLPVTNGGTGTSTTFPQGSVVFTDSNGVYTQDNKNFNWDTSAYNLFTNSIVSGTQYTNTSISQPILGNQGTAVSINGNTVVIGSSNSLSAYVYTVTNGVWSLQQTLTDVNVGSFGQSVAVYQDTIAIGDESYFSGNGAVFVYTRTAGVWTLQQIVSQPGDSISGRSCALYQDTLLVGDVFTDGDSGAVWVYTRTAGVWTLQQKLQQISSFARQGFSCSIYQDTALVGGRDADSSLGAVWVYTRTAGVWTLQQKLQQISSFARQGFSCSIYQDTALVGGKEADSGLGAVWVYIRTAGVWTLQQKLQQNLTLARQGSSCSIYKNMIVIGGSTFDSDKGIVLFYIYINGLWVLQNMVSGTDSINEETLGTSVSLYNNIAVAGAPNFFTTGTTGIARIYYLGGSLLTNNIIAESTQSSLK